MVWSDVNTILFGLHTFTVDFKLLSCELGSNRHPVVGWWFRKKGDSGKAGLVESRPDFTLFQNLPCYWSLKPSRRSVNALSTEKAIQMTLQVTNKNLRCFLLKIWFPLLYLNEIHFHLHSARAWDPVDLAWFWIFSLFRLIFVVPHLLNASGFAPQDDYLKEHSSKGDSLR